MTSLLLFTGMTVAVTGCAHGAPGGSDSESRNASGSNTPGASGASGHGKQFAVPDAAKAHTQDGALAFVKFYWDMLGQLNAHPETGVIPKFSSPNCASCAAQEQTMSELVSNGAHIEVSGAQLKNFRAKSEAAGDSITVIFNYINSSQTRINRDGSKKSMPRVNSRVGARVDWVNGSWKMGLYGADAQ